MKARKSILIQLLALMLAIAMTMVAIPLFRGSVEPGQGEPLEAVLPLFVMMGILAATFGIIRGRNLPAVGIYRAMAAAAVILTVEQGFVFGAALGHMAFTGRLMLAILFGVFVGIAPIVGRLEQNPWFGVRTPWTLGSRRVWRDTHRATAKLWFFGGIVGSALAMFGAPFLIVFSFLALLGLTPIAISYSSWRRHGRP
jgi:uncharacterized membrane protein